MTTNRLCLCGHWDDEHARTYGRCRGIDSYGIPCTCPSLEEDPDDLDEEDADEYSSPA